MGHLRDVRGEAARPSGPGPTLGGQAADLLQVAESCLDMARGLEIRLLGDTNASAQIGKTAGVIKDVTTPAVSDVLTRVATALAEAHGVLLYLHDRS